MFCSQTSHNHYCYSADLGSVQKPARHLPLWAKYWNGQRRQKFSRRILLTYHFSLPQVTCSKPSFLPFSPRCVILPGAAAARGRGCGKTSDSVSLSWRNPLSDLCISSYNDKWICNFLHDWAATKSISTLARRQREYSLPPSGSTNQRHYTYLQFGFCNSKDVHSLHFQI